MPPFVGPYDRGRPADRALGLKLSARCLDHYRWWFVCLEWVRRAGENRLDSMIDLAATGRYFLTRPATEARQRPFWDYWEGRSPEVDAVSLYGDGAA